MSFVAGYTLDHLKHHLIAPAELPGIYHWRPCAHCGALGPYVCDQRTLKPKRICAMNLVPGDCIWRLKRPEWKSVVVSIGPAAQLADFGKLDIRIRKKFGSNALLAITLVQTSAVVTYRPFPCGKIVCERCVRELADDRHCCVDHWVDFETGAAERLMEARA